MKVIDVYEQYFEGHCVFNDVPRHAAAIKLTVSSEDGIVSYEVSVTFFPHNYPEDFAVSYDAYFSKVILREKGRRTKKKDEANLSLVHEVADDLAVAAGGSIYWNCPLIPPRYDR